MSIIAPSLLSADFLDLKRELQSIKEFGAEWLHFDVMDGTFVPNISVGIPVLKCVRKGTDLFIDAHLMIVEPQKLAEAFCKNGADMITAHVEATDKAGIEEFIRIVHANGKKVGLSVKPGTPASAVIPYLDQIDMVLIMTVEPGFGGQKFMADMLPKISELSQYIQEHKLSCLVEVDGGINPENAAKCRDHGAEVFVAGSYVFSAADRAAAVASLR